MSEPLASFAGRPAPKELVNDLHAIAELSDAGRTELWRAVEAIVNLTLHHEEHGHRSTTYDVLPTMLQRLRDMLSEIVT
jgi:hypothetical protein